MITKCFPLERNTAYIIKTFYNEYALAVFYRTRIRTFQLAKIDNPYYKELTKYIVYLYDN